MDENEIDYEKLWIDDDELEMEADDEYMPELVTAEDVSFDPPEIGLDRLEIRSPETQGRLAWGYLSEDQTFIMNDRGEVYIKWDHTTTTFREDLADAKWVTTMVEGDESFEEQQDRVALLLSKVKFARVAPSMQNRLQRWIHASRLGHWLRTR